MLQFDSDQLKEILMKELGHSELEAKFTIKVLMNLDSRLQPVLDQWLRDRTISESFNYEGVTIRYVMKTLNFGFIKALAYMDRLVGRPEKAKKFLTKPPHPHFFR
jgi:hypothetical protein